MPERSIASDCNGMVTELMNATPVDETLASTTQTEKLFKLKNSIWNKIIKVHDFENFNDQEYFRWLEIYKDGNESLSNFNPVSIEQKMALVEVINMRLIATPDYVEKNLTEEAQKLNLIKLRKLQSHMNALDLTSKMSRNDLNNFAADLMIILKGPPISLVDYFTTNKTARMNARLMRMVQEDILLMGLKGMLDRIPEKNSYTRLENGRYLVKRFFQHKVWKYLIVPYDLPWFERVNIPDELLEKIMVDGLEAHDQELIAHLQKQNMIDHYERFRKVYKPMAFAIGFYFYFDKFYAEESKNSNSQDESGEKFVENFKALSEKILESTAATESSDTELKEEQFQRLLLKYKEKYNKEPSKEIYDELRSKVFH